MLCTWSFLQAALGERKATRDQLAQKQVAINQTLENLAAKLEGLEGDVELASVRETKAQDEIARVDSEVSATLLKTSELKEVITARKKIERERKRAAERVRELVSDKEAIERKIQTLEKEAEDEFQTRGGACQCRRSRSAGDVAWGEIQMQRQRCSGTLPVHSHPSTRHLRTRQANRRVGGPMRERGVKWGPGRDQDWQGASLASGELEER